MVLGDEELSENTQLLEVEIERFEVRKRRTKADNQKRQSDIKNKKKKAQELRKKQQKDLERQENVKSKIKVTLGIKTKQKVQFRSGWFSSRKA